MSDVLLFLPENAIYNKHNWVSLFAKTRTVISLPNNEGLSVNYEFKTFSHRKCFFPNIINNDKRSLLRNSH